MSLPIPLLSLRDESLLRAEDVEDTEDRPDGFDANGLGRRARIEGAFRISTAVVAVVCAVLLVFTVLVFS